MVSGEAGVSECSDVLGGQVLGQSNNVALVSGQVLRVATVAVKARERSITVHVVTTTNIDVVRVGDFRVQDDRVTLLESDNLGTNFFDPAGIFVTHDDGKQRVAVGVEDGLPHAFNDVEVGAADASTTNLDNDIGTRLDCCIGDILNRDPCVTRERLVVSLENHCFHSGCVLSRVTALSNVKSLRSAHSQRREASGEKRTPFFDPVG